MRTFIKISDGKSIHLRQGELDGACTVYSLMMGLIAARKVKKSALTDLDIFDSEDKPDGRTSFGRLLKEFFYKIPKSKDEPETVLLRNGYTLEDIQNKLSHAYSKEVTTWYASSLKDADKEGYLNRNELIDFIAEEIDKGNPVEIAFGYRKGGGHAVLAVGYERSYGEIKRLFCLDPAFECSIRGKYNAIISLTHNGRHTQYHEGMKCCVLIDEALSIER